VRLLQNIRVPEAVDIRRPQAISQRGGQLMPRHTILVLTLIAMLVGFAGCAKYPVVVKASAPAPTAEMQAPTR
jgi:hypothetical protein